jgi:hypothetical protein
LEIEILAKYFRRAFRGVGYRGESAAAKAHRLVPLIAGNTPQPEAGRYSLAMQAIADGVARREPKETINV